MPATVADLVKAAQAVSERAYAPYSCFRVGAALGAEERIFVGCNVENASYGLTSCAERNAIFQMIAAGVNTFSTIVVYTPTLTPTAPCGACRQVIFEFAPTATVISVCDGPGSLTSTTADLLPGAFGPSNLGDPAPRS
jgi:cytidine deaminase